MRPRVSGASPFAPLLVLALAASSAAAGAAPADAVPAGDAARGEAIYGRCAACHALAYDRTGPRHCGLFGRAAGAVAGFDYSPAMRNAHIVWTAASLDRFLASPTTVVPGTTMGYAGVADRQERADLIAYLARAAADPALCR
jgi:cytochrome c